MSFVIRVESKEVHGQRVDVKVIEAAPAASFAPAFVNVPRFEGDADLAYVELGNGNYQRRSLSVEVK